MDYTSIATSGPRNNSLLRANKQIDTPRLTQRTVKTGISIFRPRRSYNAAFSSRNDSQLRTTLALQQLAHVTTRCYELATTTRPYQRNVKTGTSIYQRPTSAFRNDSTDLSCPRRLSNYIQRLDRSQLTSIRHLAVSPRLDLRPLPPSNVLLRTTTTTTRPYQLTT